MNILVDIAKETENAYCISPETVHEAIKRGVKKADICIALVDCLAGNTGSFYMEDDSCCAFTALDEDNYKKAEEDSEDTKTTPNSPNSLKTSVEINT